VAPSSNGEAQEMQSRTGNASGMVEWQSGHGGREVYGGGAMDAHWGERRGGGVGRVRRGRAQRCPRGCSYPRGVGEAAVDRGKGGQGVRRMRAHQVLDNEPWHEQ
jgi:hypothetical protein